MLEDIEFRLRVRVESDSPEAIILKYLNSRQTLYPSRDMAMIALISYWLPIACRDEGMQPKESFSRVIQNSTYRLKLHLQYLQQMLGEEEVLEDVVSSKVKTPSSQSRTPLENPVADCISDWEPNGDSPNSQGALTKPQPWFNPLKPSS
jgi:hypothetical protein